MEGPDFDHEGLNGHIETTVEFEIKDLVVASRLIDSWYSLDSTQRINLYGLAKGLGDRK